VSDSRVLDYLYYIIHSKSELSHVRRSHIIPHITANQYRFHHGAVLLFSVYKRSVSINGYRIPKGSYYINYMASCRIGRGSELLGMFLSEVDNPVYLTVRMGNKKAIEVYEKYGFRPVAMGNGDRMIYRLDKS